MLRDKCFFVTVNIPAMSSSGATATVKASEALGIPEAAVESLQFVPLTSAKGAFSKVKDSSGDWNLKFTANASAGSSTCPLLCQVIAQGGTVTLT